MSPEAQNAKMHVLQWQQKLHLYGLRVTNSAAMGGAALCSSRAHTLTCHSLRVCCPFLHLILGLPSQVVQHIVVVIPAGHLSRWGATLPVMVSCSTVAHGPGTLPMVP